MTEISTKTYKYPLKLVRDEVPLLFEAEGKLTYQVAEPRVHAKLLRRKLVEESVEYLENPSTDELADLLTVLRALANHDLGVSWEEVLETAKDKQSRLGGFTKGTVMIAESNLVE